MGGLGYAPHPSLPWSMCEHYWTELFVQLACIMCNAPRKGINVVTCQVMVSSQCWPQNAILRPLSVHGWCDRSSRLPLPQVKENLTFLKMPHTMVTFAETLQRCTTHSSNLWAVPHQHITWVHTFHTYSGTMACDTQWQDSIWYWWWKKHLCLWSWGLSMRVEPGSLSHLILFFLHHIIDLLNAEPARRGALLWKTQITLVESAATATVTAVKQCRLQVYRLGSWLDLRSSNMETPVRLVSVQSSTWVSGCLPFSL